MRLRTADSYHWPDDRAAARALVRDLEAKNLAKSPIAELAGVAIGLAAHRRSAVVILAADRKDIGAGFPSTRVKEEHN